MSESPELYRLRKKRWIERTREASITEDQMPYSQRPHETLPELVEIHPDIWVPPPTEFLVWDSGDTWDSGVKWK